MGERGALQDASGEMSQPGQLGALVGDGPDCCDLGKVKDVDPRGVSDDGRLENLRYQCELVAESGVDGFSGYVCLGCDGADGGGRESLGSKQLRRRLEDRLPGSFGFVGLTGARSALALDCGHPLILQS